MIRHTTKLIRLSEGQCQLQPFPTLVVLEQFEVMALYLEHLINTEKTGECNCIGKLK